MGKDRNSWIELPDPAIGGFVRVADGVSVSAVAIIADNSAPSDSDIATAVSAALNTSMRVIGSAWHESAGPLANVDGGVYVVSLAAS